MALVLSIWYLMLLIGQRELKSLLLFINYSVFHLSLNLPSKDSVTPTTSSLWKIWMYFKNDFARDLG